MKGEKNKNNVCKCHSHLLQLWPLFKPPFPSVSQSVSSLPFSPSQFKQYKAVLMCLMCSMAICTQQRRDRLLCVWEIRSVNGVASAAESDIDEQSPIPALTGSRVAVMWSLQRHCCVSKAWVSSLALWSVSCLSGRVKSVQFVCPKFTSKKKKIGFLRLNNLCIQFQFSWSVHFIPDISHCKMLTKLKDIRIKNQLITEITALIILIHSNIVAALSSNIWL